MPRSRTNKENYFEPDKAAFMGLTEEDPRWIPQSSAEPNFDSKIEGKRWRNFDKRRLNNSSEKWKDDMLERMRTRLQAKYEINSHSLPSMEDKSIQQGLHVEDKKSVSRKEIRDHTKQVLTPKSGEWSADDDFFGIAEDENRTTKLNVYVDEKSAWPTSPRTSLSKDEIFVKYVEPYMKKERKEKLLKSQYGFMRMDEDDHSDTREKKKNKKISSKSSSLDDANIKVSRAARPTGVLGEINDNFPPSGATENTEDKTRNQNFTSINDTTGSSGSDFIESQYFSYSNMTDSKNTNDKTVWDENMTGTSYIENQYFGGNTTEATIPSLNEIAKQYSNFAFPKVKPENNASAAERNQAELHKSCSTESEKNIFQTNSAEPVFRKQPEMVAPLSKSQEDELQVHKYPEHRERDASHITTPVKEMRKETTGRMENTQDRSSKQSEVYENISEQARRRRETPKPNLEEPETAFDMAMKIRQTAKMEKTQETSSKQSDVYENISEQARRRRETPKPNLEEPETAYDMAMKIRQTAKGRDQPPENRTMAHESLKNWKGKLDSQGYRILKDQVLNLEYLPREVVVNILKDSIIFQNDDVIAIDKPYGLASHGGPGVHHSVGNLLKELASKIKDQKEPLHLIHRLDKETTGVMLLARNAEIAWKVHGMFKRREINKTYWALTKGVPNPQAGIIDIPMAEDDVKGRYRMGLRPRKDENTKLLRVKTKPGTKFEAVTEYKVLSYIASAALIQCTPLTGVKHQIRCHLAFGLNTPIIGDHKYSHFSEIKPQKLHPEILNKLKIRQPTARYLSMHLHARELVLPEFYEGRNTIIRARLPDYFVRNMKWLKLAIPK